MDIDSQDSETPMSQAPGETQPPEPEDLDIGLLIATIQNYEFLYDLSSKEYKNAKKKEMAWKEVAEVMNQSVEDCMKVWRNIRDRFVKEKNKCPSGSEAPETTWQYYYPMLFYSKFMKRRKTYTTTPNKKTASRPSSVWSTVDNMTSPSTTATQSENEETPSTSKGSIRKRNTAQCQEEEIRAVLNTAKEICSSLKQNTSSNRTCADYVCSRLEEMPAAKAQKKRKKILLLLEEEEENDN